MALTTVTGITDALAGIPAYPSPERSARGLNALLNM